MQGPLPTALLGPCRRVASRQSLKFQCPDVKTPFCADIPPDGISLDNLTPPHTNVTAILRPTAYALISCRVDGVSGRSHV